MLHGDTRNVPLPPNNKEGAMKRVHALEQPDAGLVYTLELASSISVLLLACDLIASMANVLPGGSVLTDHQEMPAELQRSSL
jgi:hypothetical protein